MLISLHSLHDRIRSFSIFRGTLRAWTLGLAALATVSAGGCAEEEPHYLMVLPDMSSGSATQGVPCAVAKLLADSKHNCLVCHGQPPVAAPLPLVSYANLTAQSSLDPTKKVIERAILRMQDATSPMPPGPTATVSPSELIPLQTWVTAGTPMTDCK